MTTEQADVAYKDTGLPWAGSIPAHWELRRTKYLFRERVEKDHPNEPLLAATQTKGVVPKDQYEFRTVEAMKDLHLLKLVEPGDFVISLRSFQGGIEYARHRGIISPAYTVLEPMDSTGEGFFRHYFKSQPFVSSLTLFVTGIREGQNIDYERLSRAFLPVPPADEQHAIARFLDNVERRVNRFIRAKRRLIALLNEQKQAIIHRAVTRGLDPDVRLKPSGVDWLGEVPKHWEVLPLRRRWKVTDCKHLTVPFVEEGVPLASVREVQSFDLSLVRAKRTTAEWYATLIAGDRAPRRGDLIYCRNVSVGSAAWVNTDEKFAMGQDVCLIRSDCENQRYLNYFLHSPAMKRQLALVLVGSTFGRINVADIKALIVAVPPRQEQDKIAAYVDETLIDVDRPIAAAFGGIELIREYRSRLIADVVTGKLDVREAAANLADEADEPEIMDAEEGEELETAEENETIEDE